jgi:hypothetical protein
MRFDLARRTLDRFIDAFDPGRFNVAKKLQSQMNVRRFGPTHFRFNSTELFLKPLDS